MTAQATATENKTKTTRGRSFLKELTGKLPDVAPPKKTRSKASTTVFEGISEKKDVVDVIPEVEEKESSIKKGYKGWAWIEQHNKWYRARVTEVLGADKFKVLYRDFYAEVTSDDLVDNKPDNLKNK